MNFNKDKKDFRVFIGRQIRAQRVLLVDGEENLGSIPIHEALKRAEDKGMDLVQFSKGDEPTCKILDYGKFRYEQSKKQKAADKKQRESEVKVKEIKFRPDTAENDLKIKAKKTHEFLKEGCRVRVSIMFRGRESTLQDQARKTLAVFLEFLEGGRLASNPSMEGSAALTFMIEPD